MDIKASRSAPGVVEAPDVFDEGSKSYAEEMAPSSTIEERKTSNIVLTILGVFLLAFIVTMIVTFWVKGSVPDTLIQCVLGAGGLEALVLAGIKVSKVIAGGKSSSDPPDGVG